MLNNQEQDNIEIKEVNGRLEFVKKDDGKTKSEKSWVSTFVSAISEGFSSIGRGLASFFDSEPYHPPGTRARNEAMYLRYCEEHKDALNAIRRRIKHNQQVKTFNNNARALQIRAKQIERDLERDIREVEEDVRKVMRGVDNIFTDIDPF